jgi:dTMP kinase
VLGSLIGRSDAFALALRERLWKQGDIHERCASLQHCDDADAWRRREKLLDKDPAVLLPTLVGLEPARVDAWLAHFTRFAPKQVLRALRGRSDAHAHALRRELLETGREVVDSLTGLDDPDAWSLRERCIERWPSTVALSLLGLDQHPRSAALLERCRAAAPHDLFLKRRLHQLSRA